MAMKMKDFVLYMLLLAACMAVSSSFQTASAQSIVAGRMYGDISITADLPSPHKGVRETRIIFYALPNGNTTAQTMGKKLMEGDDWHFDIQHIKAQTAFIRRQDTARDYIVYYLENDYKSWPSWKQKHTDFKLLIPRIIDSIYNSVQAKRKSVHLDGHSGGGSFIFGFLAGVNIVPAYVKRISFIDSDYGYDSSYYLKIKHWLKKVKRAALNVFAYNDSVALYNGKPVVSATGGTWYRSHLLLGHLQKDFRFNTLVTDSVEIYKSRNSRIRFFFKPNYNRGIYHTQQVELNGFIHSVFCGTPFDSKGYQYYSGRAYADLIE